MDYLSELVKVGGLPFALVVLALIAGARGDWVYRRTYEEALRAKEQAESDRDRLLELCLRLRDDAKGGHDVASEALRVLKRRPEGGREERRRGG